MQPSFTPLRDLSRMTMPIIGGDEEVQSYIQIKKEKTEEQDKRLDQEVKSFLSQHPNAFTTDLMASELKAQEFFQILRHCSSLDKNTLRAIAISLCVELHALKIFKDTFLEFREITKEWQKFSSRIESETFTLTTTKGLAFYFRFLGENSVLEEKIDMMEGDRKKHLYAALESPHEEIRGLAAMIFKKYTTILLEKRAEKVSSIFCEFIMLFNIEINQQQNSFLKHHITYFPSLIKSLNFSISLVKKEIEKTLFDTPWTFNYSDEQYADIMQMLCSLESDVKGRAHAFKSIYNSLLNLRSKEKGNKLEFNQKFLTHNFANVPIQILDYQRLHKEYFSSGLPKTISEKKNVVVQDKKRGTFPKKPQRKANRPPSPHALKTRQLRELKAQNIKKIQDKQNNPYSPDSSAVPIQVPQIPQTKFNFSYAWRVADWFQKHPKQLQKESYASLPSDLQFKQIIYHAFAQDVENYIFSHGRERTYENPTTHHNDRHFCIAGEIRFREGLKKTRERGIYTFCVGQDEELYHRYFTRKIDLLPYAKNIFYETDFPTPKASLKKKTFFPQQIKPSKAKVKVDEITQAVSIEDPRYPFVKYILFQSGDFRNHSYQTS
ncbi:hypothetical protein DB43_GW00120 [Parachlamydia acanthamoebae]|nr:hypothetical protein DB43_GW00120 [Parachlamydia acanthamoebae]